MDGAFGWLDNLTTQVGTIAGKAVDVVGKVADTQADRTARAQTDPRAVSAVPVSSLQSTNMGQQNVLVWVGIGAAVLLVGVLLLRK